MTDILAELKEMLIKAGIDEPEKKSFILAEYMKNILEWNKMVNITRIVSESEFLRKHIIDSLSCCLSSEFKEAKDIIDIGSGGGFPGVPLAVCFPEKKFVLLDSSAKRMNIVYDICKNLGIINIRTVHGRSEDFGRDDDHRQKYDAAVSRAVAFMPVLAEYCLPFIKIGGTFIAFKGPDSNSELSEAQRAIDILGGKIERTENIEDTIFAAPGNDGHRIVYIKKIKGTPSKFPRSAGKPSRKPIK